MSQFYALKMASEVLSHPHIVAKKGLFGFGQKVIYQPTGSKVESYSNLYDDERASQIRALLDSKGADLLSMLRSMGEIECCVNGKYRLDLCVSHDNQFVAMLLANADGSAPTAIRYFEGEEAKMVEQIFA